MCVANKVLCVPIKPIQSAPPGANPDIICSVHMHSDDSIVAECLRISVIVLIDSEMGPIRIELTESLGRSHPECARNILSD